MNDTPTDAPTPYTRKADTRAADLLVAELLTTAGFGDPYARVEQVRSLGRAVPSSLGVLVTGYDDCQQALRNPALVSNADMSFAPLLGAKWRDNRALSLLGDSLLFLEGDAHNRVRKLVAGAFTPTAVASWQPTIEAVVERLLEGVATRLRAGERVDLVEALARPLPIAVMAELLGLPHDDATRLRTMIGTIAEVFVGLGVDDERLATAHTLGEELDAYLRKALVAPDGTGVIGRIALDTNDVVSEDDRVALAFILLAAGFETTAMLVANALSLLLEAPQTWNALLADPVLANAVIEETLRMQAPAALTARVATTETTVAGLDVAAGTAVTLFLNGANRDPEKFDHAGTFDPQRYLAVGDSVATPPLSFGSGMHHCIGSLLARNEGIAVLRRLAMLGAAGELHVAEPIEWRPALALRGIETLVVARGPAAAPPTATASPQSQAAQVTHGLKRRFTTTALGARVGAGYAVSRVRRLVANDAKKTELADQFAAKSAAHAAEVLGDLKGVMMKTGQLLSFVGVGMPEVAQRSFAALQGDAPPMPEGAAEAAGSPLTACLPNGPARRLPLRRSDRCTGPGCTTDATLR
jgi:cytochrome P450